MENNSAPAANSTPNPLVPAFGSAAASLPSGRVAPRVPLGAMAPANVPPTEKTMCARERSAETARAARGARAAERDSCAAVCPALRNPLRSTNKPSADRLTCRRAATLLQLRLRP